MINNSTDSLVVIDSIPETADITAANHYGRKVKGKGSITKEIIYINNLPLDIIIVERSGFRHRVKSVVTHDDSKFIIRTLYTLSETSYEDCRRLFAGAVGTQSDTFKLIEKAISYCDITDPYKQIIIGIDHVVTYSELQAYHGNIYIRDADTVVSSRSFEGAPAHPVAKGSVSELDYNETLGKDRLGFALGVGIEMVNRSVGASPLYTYMMRSVKTIPVIADDTRNEGFYITTLDRSINSDTEQHLVTSFYALSFSESLGIYKSKDEALCSGDIKLLKEEEISRLKHDTEVIRLTAAADKIKSDLAHDDMMNKHATAMALLNESIRLRSLEYTEELRVAKAATDEAEKKQKEQETLLDIREAEKVRIHDEKIRDMKESALETTRMHENYVKGLANAAVERERIHSERLEESEREREKIKDLFENKNHERKNFSEVLKIISATITTMGVLILAYNKTFGKEK